MPDFRCHCDTPDFQSNSIKLSAEESLHLIASNRGRIGDTVIAFDGKGAEWICKIQTANKRSAILEIENKVEHRAPDFSITLAQALPKGKLLESIIRRATEIGIQNIVPMTTEHVETKVKADRSDTKIAKWEAAAIEGAKQSGNPFLPEISPLANFSEVVASSESYELKLIASLAPGAVSIKQHFEAYRAANNAKKPKSAIWLVGPEGDFSPTEIETALSAGFLPVTLGPYVLRSETAAVSALSILRSELS